MMSGVLNLDMKKLLKWVGIGIGGLIVLLIIIAIVSPSGEEETVTPAAPTVTATPAPTPEIIRVTAQELYSAYEANEVAADAKYKGKVIEVSGVVDTIGKDFLGTPYVTLTSGGRYEVWGVQCMFSNKDEPQLAQLSKGETVAVRGKCDGYLVNVLIKKCILVR